MLAVKPLTIGWGCLTIHRMTVPSMPHTLWPHVALLWPESDDESRSDSFKFALKNGLGLHLLAGAFGRYRWAMHEVVRIASLPKDGLIIIFQFEKDTSVATKSGYLVKYRNVLSMAWRHIWVCVSAHSTFEYIWVVWNHPDYPMAIPHLYARKLSWPSTLWDSTVWEWMISRGKQRSTCGLWN